MRWIAWSFAGVIAACAVLESWVEAARPVGGAAILLAAFVCLTTRAGRAIIPVAVAAAAFVIVSQLAFDSYYAPEKVRYAHNSMGSIAFLCVLLLAAALMTLLDKRAGGIFVGLLLPVLLFVAVVSDTH